MQCWDKRPVLLISYLTNAMGRNKLQLSASMIFFGICWRIRSNSIGPSTFLIPWSQSPLRRPNYFSQNSAVHVGLQWFLADPWDLGFGIRIYVAEYIIRYCFYNQELDISRWQSHLKDINLLKNSSLLDFSTANILPNPPIAVTRDDAYNSQTGEASWRTLHCFTFSSSQFFLHLNS